MLSKLNWIVYWSDVTSHTWAFSVRASETFWTDGRLNNKSLYMQSTFSLAIQIPSQQAPTFKQMGAEPGHEKLRPHQQHLPLLGALQARVLQGLQRQTVSERGCGAHPLDQRQWFVKGRAPHYQVFFCITTVVIIFHSLPFAASREIMNDSMFSRLNCAKEWCCQKRAT